MEEYQRTFFSIITVAYNSETTIEQTILSVLNQSYQSYEYLIVDGGSTDKTLDIVMRYEPKFKGKLKYISERDNGIYDAMNKGIELAKGEFIGIINSDDWYESDALQNIHYQYGMNKAVDLIYGTLRIIRNNKEFGIERVHHDFINEKMIPHPTTFIKREVYLKEGTYSQKYKYAADYDYILKLRAKGYKFAYTNNIIANYREGGATHTNDTAAIESINVRYKNGLISKKLKIVGIYKMKIKKLLNRIT